MPQMERWHQASSKQLLRPQPLQKLEIFSAPSLEALVMATDFLIDLFADKHGAALRVLRDALASY